MKDPLVNVRPRIASLAKNPATAFEPPVPESELVAAETELGISFPEPYRRFLLEVSAGHGGGAFRFARHDARQSGGAARPCPFTSADASRAVAGRSWLDARYPVDGTFQIWNHGGGEETHLVIAGPERGGVWRCAEPGWCAEGDPNASAPTPFEFVGWLEWWLTVW